VSGPRASIHCGLAMTTPADPASDDDVLPPVQDVAEQAVAQTLAWVEHAVIGLNLCPFAKAPYIKGQVRCIASRAREPMALLAELSDELKLLAAADPAIVETTLLVVPLQFAEFDAFNDFLDAADLVLDDLGLEGVIQIASFHPHYRFAGTAPHDIDNATNRSPYPTLHLLREDSVERGVRAIPEAESIYETNIRTLRDLGDDGWATLQQRFLALR